MVEVYCDVNFLNNFIREKPKSLDVENQYSLWYSLFNFLRYGITLKINIDEDWIDDEEFQHITRLFLRREKDGGKVNVIFNEGIFLDLEKSHYEVGSPFSIILCDDIAECDEMTLKHGHYFLNSKNWRQKWKDLTVVDEIYVPYEEKFNIWRGLTKFKRPVNDILIIDRYILKNSRIAKKNLFQIIEHLIPKILFKNKISIVIITEACYDNLLEAWSDLSEQITRDTEGKISFDLSIALVDKKADFTHDRRIITNYLIFESGNSFNYINDEKQVSVNTRLRIIPFSNFPNHIGLFHNLSKLADFRENTIKSMTDIDLEKGPVKVHKVGSEIRAIGSFKSRLFSVMK